MKKTETTGQWELLLKRWLWRKGCAERAAVERASFLLERIFGARTSAGETCRFLTDIYQTEIDCSSRNGIERDSFANFA